MSDEEKRQCESPGITPMNRLPAVPAVLVEDDDDDAFLVNWAWSRVSDRPLVRFKDGEEAIDYFQARGQLKDAASLILVDAELPGLDGFELMQWLARQSNDASVPKFILSTSDADEYRKKAGERGATDFYTKPARVENLEHLLNDLARRYGL